MGVKVLMFADGVADLHNYYSKGVMVREGGGKRADER